MKSEIEPTETSSPDRAYLDSLEAISPDEFTIESSDARLTLTIHSLVDHTPLQEIVFILDQGKLFPKEKFLGFFEYFVEFAHNLLLTARDNPQLGSFDLMLEIGNIIRKGIEKGFPDKSAPLTTEFRSLNDDHYLWTANPTGKKL